jgi:protein involved in temperature-dependent protein secretion
MTTEEPSRSSFTPTLGRNRRAPAGSSEALMVSVETDIVNHLIDNAWRNLHVTLSEDRAWYAVLGAEYHFCPQYS